MCECECECESVCCATMSRTVLPTSSYRLPQSPLGSCLVVEYYSRDTVKNDIVHNEFVRPAVIRVLYAGERGATTKERDAAADQLRDTLAYISTEYATWVLRASVFDGRGSVQDRCRVGSIALACGAKPSWDLLIGFVFRWYRGPLVSYAYEVRFLRDMVLHGAVLEKFEHQRTLKTVAIPDIAVVLVTAYRAHVMYWLSRILLATTRNGQWTRKYLVVRQIVARVVGTSMLVWDDDLFVTQITCARWCPAAECVWGATSPPATKLRGSCDHVDCWSETSNASSQFLAALYCSRTPKDNAYVQTLLRNARHAPTTTDACMEQIVAYANHVNTHADTLTLQERLLSTRAARTRFRNAKTLPPAFA